MSFLQKRVVVEGRVRSELSEDTTEKRKVPKEVHGDNEKTLLLLTENFSYRWKIYR